MSKHVPKLLALFASLLSACAGTLELTIDASPSATAPMNAVTIQVPCDPAALVEAVVTANHQAGSHPTPYLLSLAAGCTYTLESPYEDTPFHNGLPAVTGLIYVEGNGAAIERTAVEGAPAFRIFYVAETGALTLQNLTLRSGQTVGRPGYAAAGGAIYTLGRLSLVESIVAGSQVEGGPGVAAGPVGQMPGQPGLGGGIFVAGGETAIADSTFIANAAIGGSSAVDQAPGGEAVTFDTLGDFGRGAVGGQSDSRTPAPAGPPGFGGGEGGAGSLAETISIGGVTHLSGGHGGGGGGGGFGGAIFVEAGDVRILGSTFVDNRSAGGRGGLGDGSECCHSPAGQPGLGLGNDIFWYGGTLSLEDTQAIVEQRAEAASATPPGGPAPDLAIASVYVEMAGWQGGCMTGDTPYGARLVIENLGDAPAVGPFAVELNGDLDTIASDLAAGGRVELYYPGFNEDEFAVSVDVSNQVAERDELNNSLNTPITTPPPLCTPTPAVFTTPPSSLALAATQVAAGWGHTCALLSGGSVKCWGENISGQLGNGTWNSSAFPVDVVGLSSGVTFLVAGTHHTCAEMDSRVLCWGQGSEGQLDGRGENSPLTREILGLSNWSEGIVSLAAGERHNCALVWRGFVRCWGDNSSGELGNGTFAPGIFPVEVSGIADAAAVTANYSHTCALTREGRVYCWGFNGPGPGPLGDQPLENGMSNTPVEIAGLSEPGARVTAIDAGQYHTCALLEDSRVKCWGDNSAGQLGDGTFQSSAVPVEVTGLSGVVQIDAGGLNTCAILAGGAVNCWGHNGYGQVGDGTVANQPAPAGVTGLTGVSTISVGYYYTCAVADSGQILCWGSNDRGQLGRSGIVQSLTPVEVDWFYNTAGYNLTPTFVPTP